DRDTKTIQYRRDLVHPDVYTARRLRNSANVVNQRLVVVVVLKLDDDRALRTFIVALDGSDVAILFKNLCDRKLHFARWDLGRRVTRLLPIANPREEIRDRITRCEHRCLLREGSTGDCRSPNG